MPRRTLDIYSNTKFTVDREEEGKVYYASGKEMWDNRIWENWQKEAVFRKNGITGTTKEAKEIENLFNELYRAVNDSKETQELGLTTEEVFLINTIFSTVGVPDQIKGVAFETTVSELVEHLFENVSFEDVSVGEQQIGSVKFKAGKTDVGQEKLYKAIFQDAKKRGETAIRAMIYRLEGEWKKGELRNIYSRTVKRSGKVDIFAGGKDSVILESRSEKLQKLAKLLQGHTFSLKNYNSPIIHIGDPNLWRSLPAFYYASTQDSNFSNLARFLFVNEEDIEKNDQTVMSYQNAAQAIYNLTGVGLETKGLYSFSPNKNKAVDYLMVLLPGPIIKVKSTKDIVNNIYTSRNSFSFSGDITIDNY